MPDWLPYLILFLGAFMFGWGFVANIKALRLFVDCGALLDDARKLDDDWGMNDGKPDG